MKQYYFIDEDLARHHKESYSFDDYVNGSATAEYRSLVDKAYELAHKAIDKNKEKAMYYADTYAKCLAKNINKRFKIGASYPSVMVVGPGNFNVRKKEKQMKQLENAFKEFDEISSYLDKIENLQYEKDRVAKQGTAKDVDFANNYFVVSQNEELNRIQLVFGSKPSEEERMLLKKNGFKWSPKNKVWQRQLTDNAIYSTRRLIDLFAGSRKESED